MSAELTDAADRAASDADIRPVATSAVEDLVVRIRSLISDRHLGVGDSLPSERELCELFATSRNTVREAMRMLKAYGVVDVRPKVGAIITDNRMVRVFDLFSFNTIEISRKTFADIRTPEGKERLREDVIDRINHVLAQDAVKSVYFTEFIVQ